MAHELVGRIVAAVPDRDTDRGGQHHFVGAEDERRAEHLVEAARKVGDLVDLAHLVAEDDELVAAEPGDGVALTRARPEPLGHVHQQCVTDVVTETVVDMLEPVEVEQYHPDDRAVALRSTDGLLEPVDEELATRETGQLVVQPALFERARRFLLLRDVTHDRGRERSTLDRRLGDRDTRLELLAVGADRHHLERDIGTRLAERFPQPDPVLGGFREQIRIPAADDIRRRHPKDAFGRLVELEDRAGVVARDDRVRGGLEDAPHAQLRHAQCVLRSAVRVDVVHAEHDAADIRIVDTVRDRALEPLKLAVGPAQAQLHGRNIRRVVGDGKEVFDDHSDIVRMHEVDCTTPDQILRHVPERRFHGR